MARIPREVVDTVRERTDIVAVVSRHVKLLRRGGNYVGLCPFHQEKTPSFNVVPGKGIYHCFGCQAGGDVFAFLMQLEGLSFTEAVRELARAASVEVPERDLTEGERRVLRQKASLYDVVESACSYYQSTLWTRSEGAVARAYLKDRGTSEEAAKQARLGYAPAGWTHLLDHLHGLGFSPDRVFEAGLSREGKRDGYYDTFRDRLIFPILDARGRVIGFGGRLLSGDGPKYINSPETRLYEKSKVLYGLHQARNAISRADRVVVVEGYFDVLAMHQHGFLETVATCGTALTQEHLERIRRLTRNVVMLTDADEAGSRAAERSLPLFLEAGLQPWRVQLPGAMDPDDLLQDAGPEAMQAALEARVPLVEWVVDRKLAATGGVLGQQGVVDELLPVLLRLPAHAISQFAAKVRLNESALLEMVAQARRKTTHPDTAQVPERPRGWQPVRDLIHLFWLLVHRYDHVADVLNRVSPALFPDEVRATLARLLSGEPVAAIIEGETDPGLKRALLAIVARESLYTEDQATLGSCQILARLARPRMEHELRLLTTQVDLSAGDPGAFRSVLEKRQTVHATMKELDDALRTGDIERCVQILSTPLET